MTRAVKRPHSSGERISTLTASAALAADSAGFGSNGLQRNFVERADFARDAVVAEAIRAIGSDFRVDHRAVRAFFDAGDVVAGKREARSEFFRRGGDGDEILQPVVENFHESWPPGCSWPR